MSGAEGGSDRSDAPDPGRRRLLGLPGVAPQAVPPRRELGVVRYLAARLGPLTALLFVIVTVSAPVAYHIMGTNTVREQAKDAARQVAEAVRVEAQQRPYLWRYGTERILRYLRAHTAAPTIVHIDVVDVDGRPIELGHEGLEDAGAMLWASAPVTIADERIAEVWVGATIRQVERRALLLFGAFAGLGTVLATLMYFIPLRAGSEAELRIASLISRLRRSQDALEELNASLEHQVEERSSALRNALSVVKDKEKRLRELTTSAVQMQEAERRAISRELHDSAGQTMTAVRINLQLIEQIGLAQGGGGEKLAGLAARTIEVVDSTVEEIRRVVDQLAPPILEDIGLQAALERQCDNAAERAGVEIRRQISVRDDMGTGVEIACYRLVQETLTNIVRHAEAKRVQVSVFSRDSYLDIQIVDDGRGFEVDEALSRGRRGLAGMRERMELLGGELELASEPGKGSVIRARLPLTGVLRS